MLKFLHVYIIKAETSKFITHFTGHEAQGAWELFVMASEGRILQPIARVASIYCRIDYKLDLSNRHEIVTVHSGKILNENKLRTPDGRRIRKRSFPSEAQSAKKKKRQACVFIIC